MAVKLVQTFNFEKVDYTYDREGDVLDVSFGTPASAIAIQVEDWLAIRMRPNPPDFQGMTIVGFKRIFEKVNQYAEQELPQRMKKLARVSLEISYDDETDALIMRAKEEPSFFKRIFAPKRQMWPIFEPLFATIEMTRPRGDADPSLLRNIYVEKSLPSKEITGLKILQFTKCGLVAMEAILGAIIDSVFEPPSRHDENAHLIASALIQRFPWKRFAAAAA